MNSTKPNINVTPLIDVLLVLLIIFMVISPIKPTNFQAKIPQPTQQTGEPNDLTLIVTLNADSTLRLNAENNVATIDEPAKLIERLTKVFSERRANGVYAENAALRENIRAEEKIERTVFIKAPRTIDYGRVVKVIDAVKMSGANPISLQIDNLE